MSTCIEVTSSAIRLCRETRGRLTTLETYPVAAGSDPLETLAAAPLPKPLGKVAVLLNHPDVMLKTMLQPPCPLERLDRIVRFELQGMAGTDGEPVVIAWHLVKAGGAGDMRVLAVIAKRSLITRLKRALAPHEGKLGALTHPAVGLFHAVKRQAPELAEDCIAIDVGGAHLHLALIQAGELLLPRTVTPGMDQLVAHIVENQGLPAHEAQKLVARLGKGAPDEHHEMIRRQAQSVAGLVSTTVRFAKAQLQLDRYEPTAIYVAGAGAQVHGFVDALRERMQLPVRVLNPFAGATSGLPAEAMDRLSALPSAWTPVVGASVPEQLELDVMTEERDARAAFWRSEGAVRVACAVAALLLVLAGLRQSLALGDVHNALERLEGDGRSGYVPAAKGIAEDMQQQLAASGAARQRLALLDAERRPGRIAVELLAAIAEQQDGQTCPVVLRQYRVSRQAGQVVVELEGFAETAASRSTADVLRAFERQLVRAYEPITWLAALPKPIARDNQEFHYRIGIADRPVAIEQASYPVAGGKGLRLTVAANDGADPLALAKVAIDRYQTGESEAKVTVGANEFLWSEKTGIRKK